MELEKQNVVTVIHLGHPGSEWQNGDVKPDFLTPKPAL